jgi:hypothetical protein
MIIYKVPNLGNLVNIEFEKRYPNGTVFIDSNGIKSYEYKNEQLLLYGTTEQVTKGNLQTVLGYGELQDVLSFGLDEDRVVGLAASHSLSGIDEIDAIHNHPLIGYTSYGSSGAVNAVCFSNAYITNSTIVIPKMYVSIGKLKSVSERGHYE